jgi:hypothetical protein
MRLCTTQISNEASDSNIKDIKLEFNIQDFDHIVSEMGSLLTYTNKD